MAKTRGRKHYSRSTRKTRSEWKKRRPCTRITRRSTRRSTRRIGNKRRSTRMRGGRSNKPTVRTVEGIPITKDAVVTVDGIQGTYGLKAFEEHEKDMDRQGTGGEPGYD